MGTGIVRNTDRDRHTEDIQCDEFEGRGGREMAGARRAPTYLVDRC